MTRPLSILTALLVLVACGTARGQDRPPISKAIQKAIDERGIEAAQAEFQEHFQEYSERYDVDMAGLSDLGRYYIQAGNAEAAGAVMVIASPYMSNAMAPALQRAAPGSGLGEAHREAAERHAEQNGDVDQPTRKTEPHAPVVAREDLDRFSGLYGDPAESNETRRLWVMPSCDGVLVIGALWGGAGQWRMTSTGDATFAYEDAFTRFAAGFEGSALSHDIQGIPSPLQRFGPIPEDWDPCVEPPKR